MVCRVMFLGSISLLRSGSMQELYLELLLLFWSLGNWCGHLFSSTANSDGWVVSRSAHFHYEGSTVIHKNHIYPKDLKNKA